MVEIMTKTVNIDCSNLTTVDEIKDKIALALSFPDWYGQTWDGWSELMWDLGWVSEANIRVNLTNVIPSRYQPIFIDDTAYPSDPRTEVGSFRFFMNQLLDVTCFWADEVAKKSQYVDNKKIVFSITGPNQLNFTIFSHNDWDGSEAQPWPRG